MENVKKSKNKAVATILIVILLISATAGLLIWLFRDKLEYNYELGRIALNKVENAQYIPDVSKYDSGAVVLSGTRLGEPQQQGISKEEFNSIVDEYATVENYAGAGKCLGYDIHEIKNEIAFVVEHVPAFEQWFRMPSMREKQGYINIPYYEGWAYYLEMSEDNVLSITRVCWCTRSSYIDFDNMKIVEDHANGTSFVQYEIMKTNYYVDENEKEVVECFIYSVGIDNVKNGATCNTNTSDYYPFEYQYLKNVKDTYMIKYHIAAAERYASNDPIFDTIGMDFGEENNSGMDISGNTPYGSHREFTILNYDGYSNIRLTDIEQHLPNGLENKDSLTGLNLGDSNLEMLNSTVGLTEDEFADVESGKGYLDVVCKKIVDNFDIKNNWPEIYKGQSEALEISIIKGPFYGKKITLTDATIYTECRGHYQDEIEFYTSADVYDLEAFDLNKEYSLSVAMKERTTGELTIICTDYKKLEEVEYNYDPSYTGKKDTYFRFQQSSWDLESSVIKVEKDGVYDFVLVLTEKVDGEDVILLDTLEVAYLMRSYGLKIPDSVDGDGVTHSYAVNSTGGRLTITVTTKDV